METSNFKSIPTAEAGRHDMFSRLRTIRYDSTTVQEGSIIR